MLDTVRGVHTPEGVELKLPAAGPLLRSVAWGIDAGIRFGVLWVFAIALSFLGESGAGVAAVIAFAIWWIYPIVFEVLWQGQSPGKRAMRLRVVRSDGAPIGWQGAVVRNLLRTVDMLPLGYAAAIVTGFLDPWGRRLGDIVAGTLVVHLPPPSALSVRVAGSDALSEAVPVPLSVPEQTAVIAFDERAGALTVERQEELADLVPELTGARGGMGVRRLHAIADGLLGRR